MRQPFRKKLAWWVYHRDLGLINSPSRKNMDYFIVQVIFVNAFVILTGGEFLSGFAIYLGASDALVGYIPLIGSISGIFLIFFSFFMERFTNRRKLVLVLNSVARPLIVSVVLIPLIIPKHLQVTVLFVILIFAYILHSIMAVAINSWFIHVIPIRIRGRYFSIRQIYAVLVSVLLPVMAGRILDMASDPYLGFVTLYSIAFFAILGENYAYLNIEDTTVENIGRGNFKLKDIFSIPIKNKEFMEYTIKLAMFYLALYLSVSFTQLYMIRYLELSYTFITSMTMMSALIQIVVYSQWGKVGDRYGQQFVMEVSICFYAVQMALWALVSKGTMYIYIPLIYMVSSISNSGFLVGSFNSRYELMPEKGRNLYDGFFSMIAGLVLLVAPWIGNKFRGLLINLTYVQEKMEFAEFRIIFGLSALGLVLLQFYKLIRTKIYKP